MEGNRPSRLNVQKNAQLFFHEGTSLSLMIRLDQPTNEKEQAEEREGETIRMLGT